MSIGEVLWDVIGPAEHLGGAPFNFAAHAANLGHTVFFVSAVGEDPRGRRILNKMEEMGLSTQYVRRVPDAPTGFVAVTLDATGQPSYVIHRPAAYDFLRLTDSDLDQVQSDRPDWICFGTLSQMSARARDVTRKLLDACPKARRFYDLNLRVNAYEASVVRDLMSRTTIVKLNGDEVSEVQNMFGDRCPSLEDFCRSYARTFGWEGVCVTLGAQGCAVLLREEYAVAPGYSVTISDTVGAGDAFAAALLHGLDGAWPVERIADFANRVGALVASRPGATPRWSEMEARSLSQRDK